MWEGHQTAMSLTENCREKIKCFLFHKFSTDKNKSLQNVLKQEKYSN